MNGWLFGDGWLAAKEMWSAGCQSFVAMRVINLGRERRLFIVGKISEAEGTAREPVCLDFRCVCAFVSSRLSKL